MVATPARRYCSPKRSNRRSGRCTISGGVWHSYYDDTEVPNARGLDIDHLVPLAEARDSGAPNWSAQERRRYANDLGDARSLAAVSARENRGKADQDPREWLPTDPHARCRYLEEWTVVKSAGAGRQTSAKQPLSPASPTAAATPALPGRRPRVSFPGYGGRGRAPCTFPDPETGPLGIAGETFSYRWYGRVRRRMRWIHRAAGRGEHRRSRRPA